MKVTSERAGLISGLRCIINLDLHWNRNGVNAEGFSECHFHSRSSTHGLMTSWGITHTWGAKRRLASSILFCRADKRVWLRVREVKASSPAAWEEVEEVLKSSLPPLPAPSSLPPSSLPPRSLHPRSLLAPSSLPPLPVPRCMPRSVIKNIFTFLWVANALTVYAHCIFCYSAWLTLRVCVSVFLVYICLCVYNIYFLLEVS